MNIRYPIYEGVYRILTFCSYLSFFELDICGLSSRYFISCLPFCPVPDYARLCEKIPEPPGEDDFFSKPRRGPALHNPAGTGRPLQAEIKQRSPFFLYSPSLFSSSSCCGMRCLSSGSFFMRVISSSIICNTSAFICE